MQERTDTGFWGRVAARLAEVREADAVEAADNHAAALAEVARLRMSRGRARLRLANAIRDRDAHAARCVELAQRVTELEQQLAARALGAGATP